MSERRKSKSKWIAGAFLNWKSKRNYKSVHYERRMRMINCHNSSWCRECESVISLVGDWARNCIALHHPNLESEIVNLFQWIGLFNRTSFRRRHRRLHSHADSADSIHTFDGGHLWCHNGSYITRSVGDARNNQKVSRHAFRAHAAAVKRYHLRYARAVATGAKDLSDS